MNILQSFLAELGGIASIFALVVAAIGIAEWFEGKGDREMFPVCLSIFGIGCILIALSFL